MTTIKWSEQRVRSRCLHANEMSKRGARRVAKGLRGKQTVMKVEMCWIAVLKRVSSACDSGGRIGDQLGGALTLRSLIDEMGMDRLVYGRGLTRWRICGLMVIFD